MRTSTMIALCLLAAGCADVRMPNAVQEAQFAYVVTAITEQARERPPVTLPEAERLTAILRVATQGQALAKVKLKLSGNPDKSVPAATDYEAVHHVTRVFEEEVEAELDWRKRLEPFIPKPGGMAVTDILGGGGILALATGVLGLLRGRKNLQRSVTRKTLALAQMFEVAGKNIEKPKLAEALDGTEAQVEFRAQRGEGGASAKRG